MFITALAILGFIGYLAVKHTSTFESLATFTLGIIAVIGMMALFACILAFPTMWLWNYICPSMFHIGEIDFYHALALNVLCHILFKSSSSKSSKN